MNADLEKLIDLVVKDGEITEKERTIVLKKAIEFGEDPDYIEILMDGKLQEVLDKNKSETSQNISENKNSNKEGTLTKCPSCGAPAQSFATKCNDCGHEFRNVKAVSSITKLMSQLEEINNYYLKSNENQNEDKNLGYRAKMETFRNKIDNGIEKANRLGQTITGFPIPNTKEDLLEFLSQAFPKAKKLSVWSNDYSNQKVIQKAWLTKCEEIIIKCRFSMKDDKNTLAEIENYAKQLGIK